MYTDTFMALVVEAPLDHKYLWYEMTLRFTQSVNTVIKFAYNIILFLGYTPSF